MNRRTLVGICLLSCFLMLSIPLIPAVQSIEVEKEVKSIMKERIDAYSNIDLVILLTVFKFLLKILAKVLLFEFIIGYIWGFCFGIILWVGFSGSTYGAFFMGLLTGFLGGFEVVGSVLSILFYLYGFRPIYSIYAIIRGTLALIEEIFILLPEVIDILISNIPTISELLDFLRNIINGLFPSYQINTT